VETAPNPRLHFGFSLDQTGCGKRRKSKFYSLAHDAVIRVYDAAGNVIETHEHTGQFQSRNPHFSRRRLHLCL
jgi:hypothetical protein